MVQAASFSLNVTDQSPPSERLGAFAYDLVHKTGKVVDAFVKHGLFWLQNDTGVRSGPQMNVVVWGSYLIPQAYNFWQAPIIFTVGTVAGVVLSKLPRLGFPSLQLELAPFTGPYAGTAQTVACLIGGYNYLGGKHFLEDLICGAISGLMLGNNIGHWLQGTAAPSSS